MTSLAPTRPDVVEDTSTDLSKKKPEDFSHIVHPSISEGMLTEAYVEGHEILARCGYRFVPSRDSKRLPLCPACKSLTDGRALTFY